MKPLRIALAALVVLLSGGTLHAETLQIPLGQQGNPLIVLPERGQSPASVRVQFGEPLQRHPAVGNPPITRWDYPQFSVYFEHAHVINTVLIHARQHSQP